MVWVLLQESRSGHRLVNVSPEEASWHNTGRKCANGYPIQVKTYRTDIIGGDETETHWDDHEQRCCAAHETGD